MRRVLLDPGVLVSALLSPRGVPAQLVKRWLKGEFELVVSPSLIAELEDVLARTKARSSIPEADARELVAELLARAVLASDPSERPPRSRDPKDDYLVALLDANAADVLVSGDSHLSSFAVTPRDFLERYLD